MRAADGHVETDFSESGRRHAPSPEVPASGIFMRSYFPQAGAWGLSECFPNYLRKMRGGANLTNLFPTSID